MCLCQDHICLYWPDDREDVDKMLACLLGMLGMLGIPYKGSFHAAYILFIQHT